MGDPNEVAKAKVTIEGDIDPLKGAVREGISETERLGDASDKTTERINRGFRKSRKESRELGKGLSRLQEAFSKLLIPVALFTGIAALITKIIQARREAELFRKELETLSDVPLDKLQSALIGENFDKLGKDVAALEIERRAAVEKTLEIFETKTQNIGFALKSGLKDITGIDLGFDREDAAIDVEKAIDRINRAYDTLIEKRKQAFSVEQEREVAKVQERAFRIASAWRLAEAEQLEKNGKIEEAFDIRRRELLSQYRRELAAIRAEQEAFAKEYGDEAAKVFNTLTAAVGRAQQQALRELEQNIQSAIEPIVESISQLESSISGGEYVTAINQLTQVIKEQSNRIGRLK